MKSNPSHRLSFYRETTGKREFHWKIRTRCGDIVAKSVKGYRDLNGAQIGFNAVARAFITGRLDIGSFNIRSYEEHMATRHMTLDEILQVEKDNVRHLARIAELEAQLAEARGEKPTPKPVTEVIAETPDAPATDEKPKGKRSE